MSETVETVVEPGGWLAEFQRGRLAANSPLATYQGLLVDEIVLPQSAVENADPAQLVLASCAWTEALLEQVFVVHGEFAPESSFSYFAHDYLVQASAGGHARYFERRKHDELALKCAQQGLKSMIAGPHLDLFQLNLRLHRMPPPGARKLAQQKGYRDVKAAVRDLDKRLGELEAREPLTPRHKMWLKSLRKVQFVPDANMTKHLGRFASLNKLRAARKDEFERLRAEHEAADPAFIAARALCDMAGLQFVALKPLGAARLREVWAEGPDREGYAFRVETDRGPKAALFYVEGALFKKRLAVLIEAGNPMPLGSLSPSEADFNAITAR
jgi:hypothetical protein